MMARTCSFTCPISKMLCSGTISNDADTARDAALNKRRSGPATWNGNQHGGQKPCPKYTKQCIQHAESHVPGKRSSKGFNLFIVSYIMSKYSPRQFIMR